MLTLSLFHQVTVVEIELSVILLFSSISWVPVLRTRTTSTFNVQLAVILIAIAMGIQLVIIISRNQLDIRAKLEYDGTGNVSFTILLPKMGELEGVQLYLKKRTPPALQASSPSGEDYQHT